MEVHDETHRITSAVRGRENKTRWMENSASVLGDATGMDAIEKGKTRRDSPAIEERSFHFSDDVGRVMDHAECRLCHERHNTVRLRRIWKRL